MLSFSKTAVRRVLALPGITWPFSLLLRNRAAVLMFHRFRAPAMGIDGHDPASVSKALEYVRGRRYNVVSLRELFARLAEGRSVSRTVALTMDDGYWDQGNIASEVFSQYDCPVTTFVVTGFLDGAVWFWWDKIAYIMEQTARPVLHLELADAELRYEWEESRGWQRAREDFILRCKELADRERTAAIALLASEAEVEIPTQPPPRYAPMSWEQARRCEQHGMTFGPHTVSHLILSKATDVQCAREIADSWQRLRSQVQHAVPVFCYPNGRSQDFGKREINVLRQQGLIGAVTAVAGYPETGSAQHDSDSLFRVPRFGYPDGLVDLIQIVSGVERFKQIVRGGVGV